MTLDKRGLILYRFLPFRFPTPQLPEFEQERQLFQRHELYFSSPGAFNDPFDGKPHFHVQSRTREDFLRYFQRLVDLHPNNQNMPAAERRKIAEQLADRSFEDPSELAQAKKSMLEAVMAEISVCCFAPSYRNVLMWSHYGASHTGYCVGFRFDQLVDYAMFPDEVKYSRDYPTIDLLRDHQAEGSSAMSELIMAMLFRKAPAWRYERECRMVRIGGAGLQTIPAEMIESVTFGARVSERNREETLRIIHEVGSPVEIWQATLARDRFSISRKRTIK